jgi:hypothetical protein
VFFLFPPSSGTLSGICEDSDECSMHEFAGEDTGDGEGVCDGGVDE